MPTLRLEGDLIRIGLSRWEQLAAIHRPIALPRRAVVRVEKFAKPFRALRGLRIGTWFPGLIAYGIYFHRGGKDFVAIRRGRPAVRLVLRNERYAAVLVSVDQIEGENFLRQILRGS